MIKEMIKYKQPTPTTCVQAAVATLLQLPLDQVPDFHQAGPEAADFWEAFIEFLDSKGFDHHYHPDPDHRPSELYLASGTTHRGTKHMVVMYEDQLVHDPHEDDTGLTKIEYVHVLTRR